MADELRRLRSPPAIDVQGEAIGDDAVRAAVERGHVGAGVDGVGNEVARFSRIAEGAIRENRATACYNGYWETRDTMVNLDAIHWPSTELNGSRQRLKN